MVSSSPRITKADVLTGAKKKVEFFSDFKTSFKTTPYGNQLIRVSNEEAVKQSFKNLLLTDRGERLFQPNLGSDINTILFELNWSDNIGLIKDFIQNCADNSEPRVNLLDVIINGQSYMDLQGVAFVSSPPIDEHTINLSVIFQIINNPEPITLDIVLKRVR